MVEIGMTYRRIVMYWSVALHSRGSQEHSPLTHHDLATLDDGMNMLHGGDIRQWIAVDNHHISEFARGKRTDIIGHAQGFGCQTRCATQDVGRGDSGLP